MKIIVGLGNPGDKYKYTKHNVGFIFLDYFKKENNFNNFKYEAKFKSDISTGNYNGEKIILLKPQSFMNLSGEAIMKIVKFYKIENNNIIVIYDDLSMEFGKLRLRDKGSAGGHNGVKDIIKYFGDDFSRIKVGIGFNPEYEVSDWVLSKFSKEELNQFEKYIFKNLQEILKEKL